MFSKKKNEIDKIKRLYDLLTDKNMIPSPKSLLISNHAFSSNNVTSKGNDQKIENNAVGIKIKENKIKKPESSFEFTIKCCNKCQRSINNINFENLENNIIHCPNCNEKIQPTINATIKIPTNEKNSVVFNLNSEFKLQNTYFLINQISLLSKRGELKGFIINENVFLSCAYHFYLNKIKLDIIVPLVKAYQEVRNDNAFNKFKKEQEKMDNLLKKTGRRKADFFLESDIIEDEDEKEKDKDNEIKNQQNNEIKIQQNNESKDQQNLNVPEKVVKTKSAGNCNINILPVYNEKNLKFNYSLYSSRSQEKNRKTNNLFIDDDVRERLNSSMDQKDYCSDSYDEV